MGPHPALVPTMINRIAARVILCCTLVSPGWALAQMAPSELLLRVDRLENELRQLTGTIEQLQYRNQQLEAEVRRLQDEADSAARSGPRAQRQAAPAQAAPLITTPAPSSGGRRSDAFDPTENPGAPGAPRTLGSLSNGAPAGAPPRLAEEPASRGGGYSSLAATAPPSSSPRDFFDLGLGYLQRRDYAQAENTFRDFLSRFPSDRLAAEAQFGLGESLFQRQSYKDAASAFVVLSKKYESSAKAPDGLLRLGQSLAALGEKELACAALGEVDRKYPRAAPGTKQAVERELKRVRC